MHSKKHQRKRIANPSYKLKSKNTKVRRKHTAPKKRRIKNTPNLLQARTMIGIAIPKARMPRKLKLKPKTRLVIKTNIITRSRIRPKIKRKGQTRPTIRINTANPRSRSKLISRTKTMSNIKSNKKDTPILSPNNLKQPNTKTQKTERKKLSNIANFAQKKSIQQKNNTNNKEKFFVEKTKYRVPKVQKNQYYMPNNSTHSDIEKNYDATYEFLEEQKQDSQEKVWDWLNTNSQYFHKTDDDLYQGYTKKKAGDSYENPYTDLSANFTQNTKQTTAPYNDNQDNIFFPNNNSTLKKEQDTLNEEPVESNETMPQRDEDMGVAVASNEMRVVAANDEADQDISQRDGSNGMALTSEGAQVVTTNDGVGQSISQRDGSNDMALVSDGTQVVTTTNDGGVGQDVSQRDGSNDMALVSDGTQVVATSIALASDGTQVVTTNDGVDRDIPQGDGSNGMTIASGGVQMTVATNDGSVGQGVSQRDGNGMTLASDGTQVVTTNDGGVDKTPTQVNSWVARVAPSQLVVTKSNDSSDKTAPALNSWVTRIAPPTTNKTQPATQDTQMQNHNLQTTLSSTNNKQNILQQTSQTALSHINPDKQDHANENQGAIDYYRDFALQLSDQNFDYYGDHIEILCGFIANKPENRDAPINIFNALEEILLIDKTKKKNKKKLGAFINFLDHSTLSQKDKKYISTIKEAEDKLYGQDGKFLIAIPLNVKLDEESSHWQLLIAEMIRTDSKKNKITINIALIDSLEENSKTKPNKEDTIIMRRFAKLIAREANPTKKKPSFTIHVVETENIKAQQDYTTCGGYLVEMVERLYKERSIPKTNETEITDPIEIRKKHIDIFNKLSETIRHSAKKTTTGFSR